MISEILHHLGYCFVGCLVWHFIFHFVSERLGRGGCHSDSKNSLVGRHGVLIDCSLKGENFCEDSFDLEVTVLEATQDGNWVKLQVTEICAVPDTAKELVKQHFDRGWFETSRVTWRLDSTAELPDRAKSFIEDIK